MDIRKAARSHMLRSLHYGAGRTADVRSACLVALESDRTLTIGSSAVVVAQTTLETSCWLVVPATMTLLLHRYRPERRGTGRSIGSLKGQGRMG